MQASRRTERINVILRRYISEIISRDMKDPRLASLITIINVTVSKDIRHARVFTSVMGDSNESAQTVETLNSASGFIRQNLMPKLRTKNVPQTYEEIQVQKKRDENICRNPCAKKSCKNHMPKSVC